jgi:hypothetical protein
MLALVGFNVLNLGILAKAMLGRRYAGLRSRTAAWLTTRFRLEHGLFSGAILFAIGFAVDTWILIKWLAIGQGSMEQTIHLAFVATTTVVLGLNIVFSSFLLAMLLASDVNAE